MKYTIYRALKNIRHNYKLYIITFVELLVGTVILVCFFNVREAYDEKLSMIKLHNTTPYLEIIYYKNETNFEKSHGENVPLSYDKYKSLQEENQNVILSYIAILFYENIHIDNESFRANIVFISPYMYENLFGSEMDSNTIYIGSNYMGHDITLDDLALGASDIQVQPIINNNGLTEIYLSNLKNDILQVSNVIILPDSCIEYYNLADSRIRAKLLMYPIQNGDIQQLYDTAELITRTLNQDSEFTYDIVNPAYQFEDRSNDFMSLISTLTLISFYSLVIMVIGDIGLLIILVNRRKKANIISALLGASRMSILLEYFFEIFLLTLIGSGFGILCSVFILDSFNNSYINVSFDKTLVIITLAVDILISMIICVSGFMSCSVKNSSRLSKGGI